MDGAIALDFIGQFETLETDFQHAMDMIGLGPITLPVTNSTESRGQNYQKHYTDETREIVAKWYDREIKYLGYCF